MSDIQLKTLHAVHGWGGSTAGDVETLCLLDQSQLSAQTQVEAVLICTAGQ